MRSDSPTGFPCRFCGEFVPCHEMVRTLTYWHQVTYVCHDKCKAAGEAEMNYDCQMIDADCNNCKYFLRADNGKFVNHGWCSRFERMTKAFPMTWTGRVCFRHRKSPFPILTLEEVV